MSIKTIRPGFTLFSLLSLLSLLSLRIRHALHATLVVCSLMAALPGSVQAQTTLSDRDYIEIQQLVNKLNFALDYCTNGGEDFADLFIPGGEYIIDSGDGMPSSRNTRDSLIALTGGPDCESRTTPPTSFILHLSESLIITPTPEGASGSSYAIYPPNTGNFLNSETAGQLGIYHDVYVKTASGWKLKSRRHEINPQPGELEL